MERKTLTVAVNVSESLLRQADKPKSIAHLVAQDAYDAAFKQTLEEIDRIQMESS